jgi:hypothetical protein
VANTKDQHDQTVVFDFRDESIWAYSVSPKLSKARALEGPSDTAGIIELGDPFMEKLQDAPGVLPVEFSQVPLGLG